MMFCVLNVYEVSGVLNALVVPARGADLLGEVVACASEVPQACIETSPVRRLLVHAVPCVPLARLRGSARLAGYCQRWRCS